MAESISRHLDDNPQRQVLHLGGVFHSSQFLGTVERLAKRKAALKIAVIETVTTANDDNSWKKDKLDSGNILLLVNNLPPGFIKEENEIEFSKAVLNKRRESGNNCGSEQQPATN